MMTSSIIKKQKQEQHPSIEGKLIKSNALSQEQLAIIKKEQELTKKTFDCLVVELGFISPQALSTLIAQQSGYTKVDLTKAFIDHCLVKKIPPSLAQYHRILPISESATTLELAMADVYDIIALDYIKQYFPTHLKIIPLVANEAEILSLLEDLYAHDMSWGSLFADLEQDDSSDITSDASFKNPVTRLLNAILLDAIKQKASDIHFQPDKIFVHLKYRINGILHQVTTFHKMHWPRLCVRLKLMGALNIAESRKPQSGRFSYHIGAREVDFRLSSHPTVHGENLVARILDKTHSIRPLHQLGFSESNIQLLKSCLKIPQGLLILTGPTGAGKTTTLYSILQYLNTTEANIMTLEDPIEYQLPNIRQSEIKDMAGTSFAQGIRSLLRQDPDIIFIGEIRDEDTATMALRAVMTGHQVLTTLHTPDTFGVIPRLIDLGIPAQTLAGHLIGAVSQRLIRTLCPHCKHSHLPTIEERKILRISEQTPLYKATGCSQCHHSGYNNRRALTEILLFDDELNEMLIKNLPITFLKRTAVAKGFRSLFEDGRQQVIAGHTTLTELQRLVPLPTHDKVITNAHL